MTRTKLYSIFAMMVFAGICRAQTPAEPSKYYRLDFVVKDVEAGKVLNSRAYSMVMPVEDRPTGQHAIRSGSRIPVATKSTNNDITYIDVGVNIDCNNIKEVQDRLALQVSADVSTIADDDRHIALAPAPVIRQTRWSSKVVVVPRKPTTIFTSDDATSKRQMQLELTATPLQ